MRYFAILSVFALALAVAPAAHAAQGEEHANRDVDSGSSVVDDGSKDNNNIEGIVTADEATDNADNRNIDSFFDVWTEARRVNWYGLLRGNDSARFKAGKDLSEVVR